MPKNSQQLIATYQDFENELAVTLSPQSNGARLSAIPAGTIDSTLGTQVFLPPAVVSGGADEPSDGDFYEVIDVDGSCNATAPIVVTPPVGTSIGGGPVNNGTNALAASVAVAVAFGGVRLTYDAGSAAGGPAADEEIDRTNWTVEYLPPDPLLGVAAYTTQVAPNNFTPGDAGGAVLWATQPITPTFGSLFLVQMTYTFEGTVNSDQITAAIRTWGDATATTGGGAGTVNVDYYTTAGGSPAVTAGTGPTVAATDVQTVVATKSSTLSITAIVEAPAVPKTLPAVGLEPIAIDCLLSTGAAGTILTTQGLTVIIRELF